MDDLIAHRISAGISSRNLVTRRSGQDDVDPESAEDFRVVKKWRIGIRGACLIVAIFGFAFSTLKSMTHKNVDKLIYLRDYYRDQAWNQEAFRRSILIDARATADREKAAGLRRWAASHQSIIALSRHYATLASGELEALDSRGWVDLPWVEWPGILSIPVPPEYASPPGKIVVPYHAPMPKDPDAPAIGIVAPLAHPH